MNDTYEKLIITLKGKYGQNSTSITNPDWNQVTSWTGKVPADIKKCWDDVPQDVKLLLYHIACSSL